MDENVVYQLGQTPPAETPAAPQSRVYGGHLRVETMTPPTDQHTRPSVNHEAGRTFRVNAAGSAESVGASRYQSGAEVDTSAGILATARTRIGGPPATRLTESSVVRINGMDTTVGGAIRAGLLPRGVLDGERVQAPPAAAPVPVETPPASTPTPALAALDAINSLPSPIVARVIDEMTSADSVGLSEEDFARIERAGMDRATFLTHAEQAIQGFAQQGREVIRALGANPEEIGAWAMQNARAEWWAAIRENATQGTDLRFAALVARYRQQR